VTPDAAPCCRVASPLAPHRSWPGKSAVMSGAESERQSGLLSTAAVRLQVGGFPLGPGRCHQRGQVHPRPGTNVEGKQLRGSSGPDSTRPPFRTGQPGLHWRTALAARRMRGRIWLSACMRAPLCVHNRITSQVSRALSDMCSKKRLIGQTLFDLQARVRHVNARCQLNVEVDVVAPAKAHNRCSDPPSRSGGARVVLQYTPFTPDLRGALRTAKSAHVQHQIVDES
jgi:hypothetical protein